MRWVTYAASLAAAALFQVIVAVVANDLDRNAKRVMARTICSLAVVIDKQERSRWTEEWLSDLEQCSEVGIQPICFGLDILIRALDYWDNDKNAM